MEEIALFAGNHQFLKNVTLQKKTTNKPFVVLIKRSEICLGMKNIRGGSGNPAKANYLYSTLCSQDRVPETSCMLCNKMQIPIHLFTPVRWNMCSAKCGGRAGGSNEARVLHSKQVPHELRGGLCDETFLFQILALTRFSLPDE